MNLDDIKNFFKAEKPVDASQIELYPNKITQKQGNELGSNTKTVSSFYHIPAIRKVMKKYIDAMASSRNERTEFFRTHKPNIIMRGYESTPGLWIFKDKASGIQFIVWSDLYKKHPWKGTSFEVTLPTNETELAEAFERLLTFIGAI